jgi:hypothetical protein
MSHLWLIGAFTIFLDLKYYPDVLADTEGPRTDEERAADLRAICRAELQWAWRSVYAYPHRPRRRPHLPRDHQQMDRNPLMSGTASPPCHTYLHLAMENVVVFVFSTASSSCWPFHPRIYTPYVIILPHIFPSYFCARGRSPPLQATLQYTIALSHLILGS